MTNNILSSGEDKHYQGNINKKSEIHIQKYSQELLAEAVLIAAKPYFIVSRNGAISIEASIELAQIRIKPLEASSYLNKPYTFASEEELKAYIHRTKSQSLDTLYKKTKSNWKQYIDADDFHLSQCASDIIYTYYQDRLGLTHYLFFIGDNTSGKSNNLSLFHILAYRNFMSSDMTAANVYQFLGSEEEGQGTLCIDEADQIDSNTDLMRIFKNGYTSGFPVARVDTSQGRKQQRFFTFGFKAFSAERLPDSVTGKGFNQRIIPLPCTYGIPLYDISEILNPAGEREHEDLIAELYELRNTLLIYRLLHYHEKIPDIKVNLSAREKQLFKPLIRVFQNTNTINELLPVISRYVSKRRESNSNTLHAFLYKLVTDLIKAQGTVELESSLIWNSLVDILPGDSIPNRKLSYDSSEFGIISQKGITETLNQVFGAKNSKNRRDKRRIIFSIETLKRLSRIYDVSVEVKVGTSVTDVMDVTDIGLDRYATKVEYAQEITKQNRKEENNKNNGSSSATPSPKVISEEHAPKDTKNPSQVSQASPLIQQQAPSAGLGELKNNTHSSTALENIVAVSETIHRIHPHSDMFGCDNCNLRGDKWEMTKHVCRGLR